MAVPIPPPPPPGDGMYLFYPIHVGDKGWKAGRMGEGGLQVAEEERLRDGISKRLESRRNIYK